MNATAAGVLLSRTDEIRAVLRELVHADSQVSVCAVSAYQENRTCPARVMGPDWHLRHFFWRPHDLDAFEAHLNPRLGYPLDEIMLDFTAATPDGGDIRFRVARPLVMHFVDSSAAMLSGFPDLIWYQRAAPPVGR